MLVSISLSLALFALQASASAGPAPLQSASGDAFSQAVLRGEAFSQAGRNFWEQLLGSMTYTRDSDGRTHPFGMPDEISTHPNLPNRINGEGDPASVADLRDAGMMDGTISINHDEVRPNAPQSFVQAIINQAQEQVLALDRGQIDQSEVGHRSRSRVLIPAENGAVYPHEDDADEASVVESEARRRSDDSVDSFYPENENTMGSDNGSDDVVERAVASRGFRRHFPRLGMRSGNTNRSPDRRQRGQGILLPADLSPAPGAFGEVPNESDERDLAVATSPMSSTFRGLSRSSRDRPGSSRSASAQEQQESPRVSTPRPSSLPGQRSGSPPRQTYVEQPENRGLEFRHPDLETHPDLEVALRDTIQRGSSPTAFYDGDSITHELQSAARQAQVARRQNLRLPLSGVPREQEGLAAPRAGPEGRPVLQRTAGRQEVRRIPARPGSAEAPSEELVAGSPVRADLDPPLVTSNSNGNVLPSNSNSNGAATASNAPDDAASTASGDRAAGPSAPPRNSPPPSIPNSPPTEGSGDLETEGNPDLVRSQSQQESAQDAQRRSLRSVMRAKFRKSASTSPTATSPTGMTSARVAPLDLPHISQGTERDESKYSPPDECPVCYKACNTWKETFSTTCNHHFHQECWKKWVDRQPKVGQQCNWCRSNGRPNFTIPDRRHVHCLYCRALALEQKKPICTPCRDSPPAQAPAQAQASTTSARASQITSASQYAQTQSILRMILRKMRFLNSPSSVRSPHVAPLAGGSIAESEPPAAARVSSAAAVINNRRNEASGSNEVVQNNAASYTAATDANPLVPGGPGTALALNFLRYRQPVRTASGNLPASSAPASSSPQAPASARASSQDSQRTDSQQPDQRIGRFWFRRSGNGSRAAVTRRILAGRTWSPGSRLRNRSGQAAVQASGFVQPQGDQPPGRRGQAFRVAVPTGLQVGGLRARMAVTT